MNYALHGSPAFNERLDVQLQALAHDVQALLGDNLVALLLGGGYGRGEGGVVWRGGREHPYNDVDLVLVVRRRTGVPTAELAHLGERYGKEMGLEVDFSRPLTMATVRELPHTLRWYELVNGHRVLAGPQNLFTDHVPACSHSPLPASEAVALLLNRGAGLLWAMRVERDVAQPPDSDFVRRNYYKCLLALGDALLIAHGRYVPRYRGRERRFTALVAENSEIAAWQLLEPYRQALTFKLTPGALPEEPFGIARLDELADAWGQVLLHVERRRTGKCWGTVDEYARWSGLREPMVQPTLLRRVRYAWYNARTGVASLRSPREHLHRALPVLLGLTRHRRLRWSAASAEFLGLWFRFN